MRKILVTGGAGYIGSILVRLLLKEGYKVRVLDNLTHHGESIVELLNNGNFEFIKGDICNEDDLRRSLNGINYVVNFAAIVGDPACAKNPDLARKTNYEASKILYDLSNTYGCEKFVFASTCSNYGKMNNKDEYADESSKLKPISIYAETKVALEKYLFSRKRSNTCKPTCMRFSTVYGISPRMRFDLTVNEFTKEVAMGRELIIFGEQFWRPYCHVEDIARSVITVLETVEEKVAFEVFNVGATEENYQKQMLAQEILKQMPEGKIKYVPRDEDPRDYRVSFEKIKNNLDFKITKTIPDGIAQIKKIIKDGFLNDPDDQKYKNS